MMTKRIPFLLVLLGSVAGSLSGQISSNMTLNDFYRNFRNVQLTRHFGEGSEITGSPYEAETFVPGEIITKSGLRYSEIPMRYNIYSDEIEFKNPEGETFVVGLPDVIDTILIGEKKFVFFSYQFGNKPHKGYLQVLTNGDPALLQKMNIFLKPAEPAQGYKDPVPAGFERTQDDFYLTSLPYEATKLGGRKELAELLPDHQTELEQFIKANKIKFSKADDLIKLINYYNALSK